MARSPHQSTRRFRPSLLFFVLLLGANLPASIVYASGWETPHNGAGWGRFFAGMASGIAAHELGHVAVAKAQGNRVAFSGPSLTYPGATLSRSQRLHVSSAGYQAQWLVAEGVLQHHEAKGQGHRLGHFSAGLVSAHLAISAAYVVALKSHKNGDLTGVSNSAGVPRDQLLLMLSVPALLDGWRLFGNRVPRWAAHLSLAAKGTGISLIWSR